MIEINPAQLQRRDVYKLMTGSIVPRPIAWVSSVGVDGVYNLAPFSYFSAVSANPPLLLFCPGYRATDGGEKDTYHNVKATGEFVVNFVNEATAEAMNTTAVEASADVDEFERAGLTPIPSKTISVPRVAESPIHFECKLHDIIDAGEGHIVIGRITLMHFSDEIYQDGHYVDPVAYQPIGRLAGGFYSYVREFFQLRRPPSEL